MKNRPLDILMLSYWDFQEYGMQATIRTPLYFASQGHNVTFIVFSETTSEPSLITNLHQNINIIRLDLPLKWLNKVHIIKRIRQFLLFSLYSIYHSLRVFHNGRKPDVIYAAEADAVMAGLLLRHIFSAPLVTRFYGISRITAFFDDKEKRLKGLGFRHLSSRFALTRKADMVIVTDDGSRGEEVIKAINSDAKNIRFWRNGIDRPEVTEDEILRLKTLHEIEPNEFILLTLCRLDPMKRIDRAIRALRFLHKDILVNMRLLIVGQGSEIEKLKQMGKEVGVEEHIEFVGAVRHDVIYGYYKMANIFLTLYDLSNVGNPLLEALNAGCCIIALNTGRTADLIKNDFNGKLIEFVDNEDLIEESIGSAIEELYRNPSRRKYLADNAAFFAKEHLWTWNDRLKAELAAIAELVG